MTLPVWRSSVPIMIHSVFAYPKRERYYFNWFCFELTNDSLNWRAILIYWRSLRIIIDKSISVSGYVTEWSVWTPCQENTGYWIQSRTRSCKNRWSPNHDGVECSEPTEEDRECLEG
jgi:hypothetical protein